MEINLSPDQSSCSDTIMDWWKERKSLLLTMGGFAGTGKSTLVAITRQRLAHLRVAFCAFTGKASSVLRGKLRNYTIMREGDFCGTIHSLIYAPVLDSSGTIIDWRLRSDKLPYDLIILDEASMVNEDIFYDLESFQIPILAVGDHGQLPPVGGKWNLMETPQIKLEKIHRHAEDNPIVKLSFLARTEGYIPYGIFGKTVVKTHAKDPLIEQFIAHSGDFLDSVIICGFNKTRVSINQKVRKYFGQKGPFPKIGERVICLKNNSSAKDCPIYNGIQGTVEKTVDGMEFLDMKIKIDGETDFYRGPVSYEAFNNDSPNVDPRIKVRWKDGDKDSVPQSPDIFDFGYCLSVHKSQGSEWRRVMLIEQPCQYWSGEDWNRWLYTAVTRATQQLLIVR